MKNIFVLSVLSLPGFSCMKTGAMSVRTLRVISKKRVAINRQMKL